MSHVVRKPEDWLSGRGPYYIATYKFSRIAHLCKIQPVIRVCTKMQSSVSEITVKPVLSDHSKRPKWFSRPIFA